MQWSQNDPCTSCIKYVTTIASINYRAATIILREDSCHFLRVDKGDFNRILRDVEANTVRLKEHGKDVLILEKISSSHSHYKYEYYMFVKIEFNLGFYLKFPIL